MILQQEATQCSRKANTYSSNTKLIADNKTRWNSVYDMLVRAYKLKIRFQAYCDNWREQSTSGDGDRYNVSDDKLLPEEWDGVREVMNVLAPFKKLTKQIERRETSLQDYIPIFDKIIDHLQKTCQRFKRQAESRNGSVSCEVYEWLQICTESALDKAKALYKKIDDSPAYYTARVVDPRFKFEWFEHRWGTDSEKRKLLAGLKEAVNNHWQEHRERYQPEDLISQQIEQINLTNDSDTDIDDNDNSLNLEEYMSAPCNPTASSDWKIDGFEKYASSPPQEDFALNQWQSIEQKHPDLVQFALDHAAIPISSSECERSFSSAKFALTPLRSKMKSDLFEALETLRAWYLDDQAQRKQEMDRIEQDVISEALKDGGGVPNEK